MRAVLRHLNMGEKINTEEIATLPAPLNSSQKLHNFDMRPTLVRLDHQKLSRKQIGLYSGGLVSSIHHRHLNMGEKIITEDTATQPIPLNSS